MILTVGGFLAAASCADGEATVRIVVRTELEPRVEFDRVSATAPNRPPLVLEARSGLPFDEGVEMGQFDAIPYGNHRFVAELSLGGAHVASGASVVRIAGDATITITVREGQSVLPDAGPPRVDAGGRDAASDGPSSPDGAAAETGPPDAGLPPAVTAACDPGAMPRVTSSITGLAVTLGDLPPGSTVICDPEEGRAGAHLVLEVTRGDRWVIRATGDDVRHLAFGSNCTEGCRVAHKGEACTRYRRRVLELVAAQTRSFVIGIGGSGTATLDIERAVCGNGLVDLGEACDDANIADDDGCSRFCSIEIGPPGGAEGEVNDLAGAPGRLHLDTTAIPTQTVTVEGSLSDCDDADRYLIDATDNWGYEGALTCMGGSSAVAIALDPAGHELMRFGCGPPFALRTPDGAGYSLVVQANDATTSSLPYTLMVGPGD